MYSTKKNHSLMPKVPNSGIIVVLADKPNNKTAGTDTIYSELWELAQNKDELKSNLAKLILKLAIKICTADEISKLWTFGIVIPVPKNRDLNNNNNYREILLIPTIVKLVSKIAANILNDIINITVHHAKSKLALERPRNV
ncbi:hypothetical protein BB561_002862 [Smittium simulii]|uniref:Reverse transcriptase domain-containing protein n=1 Tax=Smittium simulii TaxID=133385 RepID=A0A2T9YNX7_9FUNG|nr:hypothetical protein BB561_002862 [Smittium simulii]